MIYKKFTCQLSQNKYCIMFCFSSKQKLSSPPMENSQIYLYKLTPIKLLCRIKIKKNIKM